MSNVLCIELIDVFLKQTLKEAGRRKGFNLVFVGVETKVCFITIYFNGIVYSCMNARNFYFAEFKVLNGVITKTIEDCFIKTKCSATGFAAFRRC